MSGETKRTVHLGGQGFKIELIPVSTPGEAPDKPFDFTLEIPATLTVIVRNESDGGYSAEVPALPGCITEGATIKQLRENLKEATDGWLKANHDLALFELARL